MLTARDRLIELLGHAKGRDEEHERMRRWVCQLLRGEAEILGEPVEARFARQPLGLTNAELADLLEGKAR